MVLSQLKPNFNSGEPEREKGRRMIKWIEYMKDTGVFAGLSIFRRLENIKDIYNFVSLKSSKKELLSQYTINYIIIQINA